MSIRARVVRGTAASRRRSDKSIPELAFSLVKKGTTIIDAVCRMAVPPFYALVRWQRQSEAGILRHRHR
ncbi:hypothetical protein A7X12_03880 [Sphingomonas sp. TDK1]|nr:hypothetical protein A7X12_03880 [Sphingomonas sp. TDK1]